MVLVSLIKHEGHSIGRQTGLKPEAGCVCSFRVASRSGFYLMVRTTGGQCGFKIAKRFRYISKGKFVTVSVGVVRVSIRLEEKELVQVSFVSD